MKKMVLFLFCLGVCGCVPMMIYTKPDMSNLQRDTYECQQQGLAGSNGNMCFARYLERRCMEQRGYAVANSTQIVYQQSPVVYQPVQPIQAVQPVLGPPGYVPPPSQIQGINQGIQEMQTGIQKQNDQTAILLSGTKFTSTNNIMWVLGPNARTSPDENCLFGLDGMQVMQTTQDGVLMRLAPGMGQDEDIIAFLYTNKSFVDGVNLYGLYASYVGTYQYQTVLGTEKNIYAFKLFDRNQKENIPSAGGT